MRARPVRVIGVEAGSCWILTIVAERTESASSRSVSGEFMIPRSTVVPGRAVVPSRTVIPSRAVVPGGGVVPLGGVVMSWIWT